MRQITAVHMTGGERHEHIASVHYTTTAQTGTFQATRESMVDWLRQAGNKAIVKSAGTTVDVKVVNAIPPYIRTYADNTPTDNLLWLPRY